MLKVNQNSPATSEVTTQESEGSMTARKKGKYSPTMLVVDITILVVLGLVLFWGTSTEFGDLHNDVNRDQCYAIAFWQGQAGLQAHGLQATPGSQCSFLLANSAADPIVQTHMHSLPSFLQMLADSQSSTQAFHALPTEYPFLTLIPFSIPLLAPFGWYQIAFALMMTVVAGLIYVLLVKYQSRSAAIAFTFYLAVGNWATTTGRFDLIVVAFILGAILLANARRWKWAFALLALATLYKFYPIVLVIPFLLAQQVQYKEEKWYAWRRWSGLSVYVGLGVLVTSISLLSNVNTTILPLLYFNNRPFEIESFPASLLWIGTHFGHPIQFNWDYQSLNLTSSLSPVVSVFILLLEIGGLFCVFWWQWRHKLTLAEACMLTVLVILFTGKVFCPQYLIWVTPLIALVGKANWKWLLTWGLVGALTTFVFPFHWSGPVDTYHVSSVIFLRNILILGIICSVLYWCNRRKPLLDLAVLRVEQW